MNKEELLPCPFCGESPTIIYKESPSNIIECNGESCYFNPCTHNADTWENCVKAWNTRSKQSEQNLLPLAPKE